MKKIKKENEGLHRELQEIRAKLLRENKALRALIEKLGEERQGDGGVKN